MYTYSLSPLVQESYAGRLGVALGLATVLFFVAILLFFGGYTEPKGKRSDWYISSALCSLIGGFVLWIFLDIRHDVRREYENVPLPATMVEIHAESGHKGSSHLYATYEVDGKYVTFLIKPNSGYSKNATVYRNTKAE